MLYEVITFSGVAQQPEEAESSTVISSNDYIQTEITTLTKGSLIVSAVGHGEPGLLYSSHGSDQIERHNFSLPSSYNFV